MRSIVRRFGDYRRRYGLRAALARAVTSTLYRRLVLFEMPLAQIRSDFRTRVPIAFENLRPESVEELLAVRPEAHERVVRSRLARGEICVVGRSDGRIMYFCWYTTGSARFDYLRSELPLQPSEVYVFDAWVDPEFRRDGVGLAAFSELVQGWQGQGLEKMIGALEPENTAAFAVHASLPTRYLGRMVSLGLGPLRVSFRRPGPETSPSGP